MAYETGSLLPLSDPHLQDQRLSLLTDRQEVESVCQYIGRDESEVSGVLVQVQDGDYAQVWITGYQRPWRLDAVYELAYIG